MKKVIVFGTFDLVHKGHINFLEQAKSLGDELVCLVSHDSTVLKVKGKAALYTQKKRVLAIEELNIANNVIACSDTKDKLAIVHQQNPDIICLGYDQAAFTDLLTQTKYTIIRLNEFFPEKYKSSHIKHMQGL